MKSVFLGSVVLTNKVGWLARDQNLPGSNFFSQQMSGLTRVAKWLVRGRISLAKIDFHQPDFFLHILILCSIHMSNFQRSYMSIVNMSLCNLKSEEPLRLKHLHCDDLHIILSLSAVQIYEFHIFMFTYGETLRSHIKHVGCKCTTVGRNAANVPRYRD